MIEQLDMQLACASTTSGKILEQAKKYIDERSPHITIFEGAATSDPIPIEPYTHSLKNST